MKFIAFVWFLSGAPIATGVLTLIAGFVAPFITQALKRAAKLTGRWPVVLTAGVSVTLGLFVFGVAWFTGEATSWRDALTLAPWVFTEATLLYHLGMPVEINPGPPVELTQTAEQQKAPSNP